MCLDDTLASRWMKEMLIIKEDLEFKGVQFDFSVASGDYKKQLNQAKQFIDEGIEVLIIVPVDGNKAKEIVEYGRSNNTKIIAYSRLIHHAKIDYFMGFNAEEIGKKQAEYIIKKTIAKNIVILDGPMQDINSQLIRKGQFSIFNESIRKGNIKITEKELTNWSDLEALTKMEDLLDTSHDEFDAVLTCSDMIAESVLDVFNIYHLNILITGSDAEPSALKRIQNDQQLMTIFLDVSLLAHQTADLVFLNILTENKFSIKIETVSYDDIEIKSHLLDPIVIDKNNLTQKAKQFNIKLD